MNMTVLLYRYKKMETDRIMQKYKRCHHSSKEFGTDCENVKEIMNIGDGG